MTPSRVLETLVQSLADGNPDDVRDIAERMAAAWERDRADLAQRRRECVRCGQVNLPQVHSCYDRNALTADYYQRWQDAEAEAARLRERLAAHSGWDDYYEDLEQTA